MDTLQNIEAARSRSLRTDALPKELAILATFMNTSPPDPSLDVYGLWNEASRLKSSHQNQALFWDRLCQDVYLDKASSTPFLSEQDSMVYSVAKYQLRSNSHESTADRIYLTQDEFQLALRTTVLGISSLYHIWDAEQERFLFVKAHAGRGGCLIVDGRDEDICQSIMKRFLTIGTLLRRLETLLTTLRARSAQDGPTIHSFAHSMSTILAYLRESISQNVTKGLNLSTMWMQYATYEEILVTLSSFYGRSENTTPEDYLSLPSAPVPLLNRIYNELALHVERQSPQVITAMFAFILTNTCHDFFRDISQTVGYCGNYIKNSKHVVGERVDQYAIDEIDEDVQANDMFEAMEQLSADFPSFFPPELLEVLPAAQKSLILLQAAQPEHPLLVSPQERENIKWFWTEKEIEAAWNKAAGEETISDPTLQSLSSKGYRSSTTYKPELSQFQIFDQEPGSYTEQSAFKAEMSTLDAFRNFIDRFPDRLPSITPTLPHLASLVFSKLVDHASKLSNTLLFVFLSANGNLNLRAHLELLRSFLLTTLPAFESRLSSALFSDAEEYELDAKPNGMSLHSLRRRSSKKIVKGSQPWAVGLAPALLEREAWPPVGADLGFFLRTVIVDSIEDGENENVEGRDKVREEAEYRLGFAIRDLPVGSGKRNWLNPLSIEALDFLYMDYKPPRALAVLITPDILSKYQRVFGFILRLMRVTHAIKAVHRMSRSPSKPLFQTLAKSRKLLLHFRFVAQSFVANLSAYVFDIVIGGNFDPFIGRLTATAAAASSTPPSPSSPTVAARPLPRPEATRERFRDVFSLSNDHSELLDNILSACLLRSGQREVGDILRQSLELVLEFSVVVGELHRGRLEEYQAAPMIDELYGRFRAKTRTFTRVLKELAEKTGGASSTGLQIRIEAEHEGGISVRRATGGIEALTHLLVRLDMGEWWTGKR
ncbi:hypothetical protein AX17_001435 [Amanita inopinata Kibby_2008]|nr:hypothetical protein AX17_001435 [Amanita inopinata Kibby_2008]